LHHRPTIGAIAERVALLTTQGRALGITFSRRICMRVTSPTQVGMALGDGAFERGAWANRIGDSQAGVGYAWGEGIREPLYPGGLGGRRDG
jgi:S-DNA-T family DNA segregation ATPase FtsK/SpoIIIE